MEQTLYQDYDIGPTLRKMRNRAGLTQEQVAARLQLRNCDVTRATYAQMESCSHGIKLSVLAALKEIFRAEYGDFFVDLP